MLGEWLDTNEDFIMANLDADNTGIVGIVHVSTRHGNDGPRIKYYKGRPGGSDYGVLTISSTPRLLHDPISVEPRVLEQLKQWVAKNHQALDSFWWEGLSWTKDEVDKVLDNLLKV